MLTVWLLVFSALLLASLINSLLTGRRSILTGNHSPSALRESTSSGSCFMRFRVPLATCARFSPIFRIAFDGPLVGSGPGKCLDGVFAWGMNFIILCRLEGAKLIKIGGTRDLIPRDLNVWARNQSSSSWAIKRKWWMIYFDKLK